MRGNKLSLVKVCCEKLIIIIFLTKLRTVNTNILLELIRLFQMGQFNSELIKMLFYEKINSYFHER